MSSEKAHMCDTLRILHLPPQLSDDRRNELLRKYGAIKTRTRRLSRKYSITFAKFQSEEAASEALLRLHQLNVKGQRLSVEFAKKSIPTELTEHEIVQQQPASKEAKREAATKSHFQIFLQRLNSWTMNQVLTQPPPPNIRYKYDPPTRSTLLRIAIQLLKEPAFYTQVLHLMNRMNLPPPFEELESEFPMLKEVYDMEKYQNIFGKEIVQTKEDISDDDDAEESEIESEEDDNARPPEIIPMKRKRLQSKKRLKIPKFVNPAKQGVTSTSTQKVVKPEDMFEPIQREEAKNLKIELKAVEKLLDMSSQVSDTITESAVDGGFGLMFPNAKSDAEQTRARGQEVISSEELADNRLSANDQRLLSVFKNYHPGKPSNRLYIKNLAKLVQVKDLHFIYRKYIVPGVEQTENEYNVRLMQEGRMKGQAFITLPSVEIAQLALEETNGYIMKDKPMVVQFAKASKPHYCRPSFPSSFPTHVDAPCPIAMDFGLLLQHSQYAVPVGIVLLGAILVFVFGFKKAEQPPFAQLASISDVDRKLASKKRGKVREKKTANGQVTNEKASPAKKTVSSKTEVSKKSAAKGDEVDGKLKERKQEDNKAVNNKKDKDTVTAKTGKENKVEQVKNKKNLKNLFQEKPVDFDDGDWEQAYSRKDKKNKKKEEESPSKKSKKAAKKADLINEAVATQKEQEKPEIKDKVAKETENKELKEKDKKEVVLTPISDEEGTKEKELPKEEEHTKVEKVEKEEKKNTKAKKSKKVSESESAPVPELPTPKVDSKPVEQVVQKKVESTEKTSDNVEEHKEPQAPAKTGLVFDELGDVWTEAKPQKKSKKKARKDN
ncbi:hypothetical protein KM043_012077 [Ampulex compressa]|nr:hypothetical protein KM043_012077 [Ampulex compressa]